MMNHRLLGVLVLIVALFFIVAASSAPRLHERLHNTSAPRHECAVTMFASGNCEHAACDQIAVAAKPLPPFSAFLPQRLSMFIAALKISILEHAPPVAS